MMATVSGPLFHSDAQVAGMLHEIEREIAQRGWQLVQANLASSLRHPTGHYQSQIKVSINQAVSNLTSSGLNTEHWTNVNDSNVVYGPWLEGVGSRNRTTRFKGYFSFRRASQQLDKEAVSIAMPIVEQFIRAVN